MTYSVEQPCWKVYGWSQGRWTLRSTHTSPEQASEQAEYLHHRDRIRTKVRQETHRVIVPTPYQPTDARLFRERQADRMALRRQAHTYYKSGCNGTELIHLDETGDTP